MNREILFKAKRKDNGEWVEGFVFEFKGEFYIMEMTQTFMTAYYSEESVVDFNMRAIEIDPDTICQYTGLTDKNGKKIWENDILKANLDESYPEDITYIKILWNECGFCVNENYSTDIWTLEKWDAEHFQVCGNIFDNPDLLEVK